MRQKHRLLAGLLSAAALAGLLAGCDFLDVVPDEVTTGGDVAKDRNAAYNFLYSCYGYLPQPNAKPSSLDLLTGDEMVSSHTHEAYNMFQEGNYSASAPVISYWNTLFQGIRQCHMFLDELNRAGNFNGLEDADREDYKAQVKFLIAYYDFLLARCYGPIILVRETPDATTSPDNYLGRTPYDECVSYICDLFDEAAEGLPPLRVGNRIGEFGHATSIAAKCMKAKMLLYAASPLFNGNSAMYSDFRGPDGAQLMPQTYDAAKWERARDAYREAIELAEAAGYRLYDRTDYRQTTNAYPEDGTVRRLRYCLTDWTDEESAVGYNPEVIYADARDEGNYGVQTCSVPYNYKYLDSPGNGIGPTIQMLDRFYTKNGIPIAEDKTWDYDARWDLVTVDADHAEQAKEGQKTMKYNLDREPRYYAWIAFQGGFYELLSAANNGAYNDDASYNAEKGTNPSRGRLVVDFVVGGNMSRGRDLQNLRSNDVCWSGFGNKKTVNPDIAFANGNRHVRFPWPLIRLADLYLGYAECLVETGDLATARAYVDRVRSRAGLPGVSEAWANFAKNPGKPDTQEGMRDIVRQERMVEMYLENQNFWDMRRWLLAERYFGTPLKGLNSTATRVEDLNELVDIQMERNFRPANYLMPIPIDDINKNTHIVQNPGY